MEIILTKRQTQVLNTLRKGIANEILFGGAAGGGKSYLLRALAIILCMEVPKIQVFLFRRKVKDLVATHMNGPTSFENLLDEFKRDKLVNINKSNNYISFENGSQISLNHCQHESDLSNFLSAEFHVLLLDESTTFTEAMIRFLRGRLRLGSLVVPEHMKKVLPCAVYGTNPRGPSHGYFKRNFVDAEDSEIPFRAPRDDGGMKRMFIPSLLSDNPHIEADYADKLAGLGDPDIVEAYLSGDWSIVEGAALTNMSKKHHQISHKLCCKSWPLYRAYDYGYSAPYFVMWYREATGESSTSFNPPKGTIIIDSELYGADKDDKGLKEDVKKTAKKMRMHEDLLYLNESVDAGPADTSIFDKEQGPSIYSQINRAEKSIEFVPGDKTPGSRVHGLSEARTRLYAVIEDPHGAPGLYFTKRCKKAWAQLTTITTDDKNIEDVDTEQNDHSWDVLRYILLKKSNKITFAEVHGT